MAVRSLTPAQNLENEAFLAELCRSGNAREAARRPGAHRAKHPEFAAMPVDSGRGIDADRRLEFLRALQGLGSVRFTAEIVGFSHSAFYHYRDRDREFDRAWRAIVVAAQLLFEEMTGARLMSLAELRRWRIQPQS